MSLMELRHLRHFVVVAEELHFARAAAKLGLEQSPLSSSIRKLETELGVKLFQRTTRRTWLTRAGSRFYKDAKRILRDVDSAAALVKKDEPSEMLNICLALGEDLASDLFTELLSKLEHSEPKVVLDVRELDHTGAARLVRDRGADVAVTLSPRSEPELKLVKGWSEPLMVIAPFEHSCAARDVVSLRELTAETLALPLESECPGYLVQVETLLNRHDVRPAERRNARHWNTAMSFAAIGHAIALCPTTMVQTATAVAVIPIEEADANLVTYLLYREDEASPAVSLVLEIVAGLGEVGLEPRSGKPAT